MFKGGTSLSKVYNLIEAAAVQVLQQAGSDLTAALRK